MTKGYQISNRWLAGPRRGSQAVQESWQEGKGRHPEVNALATRQKLVTETQQHQDDGQRVDEHENWDRVGDDVGQPHVGKEGWEEGSHRQEGLVGHAWEELRKSFRKGGQETDSRLETAKEND